MPKEQQLEEMLDDLDEFAARAARLKCASFQRLLAMAYLELRLYSIQVALAKDAAELLARIRRSPTVYQRPSKRARERSGLS